MLLHDIIFIFQLNDLSDLNMEDEDLIIILSNLLNNAIEACEQCQCKKVIKLKFVREEEVAIISCKNTYEHEIIYKNNQIQTSKQKYSSGLYNYSKYQSYFVRKFIFTIGNIYLCNLLYWVYWDCKSSKYELGD